jgi:Na+/H+ antiporter NhaC
MASAADHIDHVRTQLPYAFAAAAAAFLLFLIFGFVL